MFSSNDVLLVKIEGPVWYTIYHHFPVVNGVSSTLSINQPTNQKRTSMFSSNYDMHSKRFVKEKNTFFGCKWMQYITVPPL
jgi:hypothetical protein